MNVLVLGDLIIDEYHSGTTTRLSPEAPVPVILNPTKTQSVGGAGNVALNAKAMGSIVRLITQVDNNFNKLLLNEIDCVEIIPCEQTPNKLRVLANNHVICRLDTEQYQAVIPSENWITPEVNVCVLSDYNKGFLDNCQDIIKWCSLRGIRTIVDPKKDWDHYRNCWLLKANYNELTNQYKEPFELKDLHTVCSILSQRYNIENLIITLGQAGLFVWTNSEYKLFPVNSDHVIDVTGAGDVVIAALAHYISRGINLITAAERANNLAQLSVRHARCYVITREDAANIEGKVVFTNGCFDILHKGHIDYLKTSKTYGTKLVVGLNSDASVRALKGEGRPYNNQNDRKALLESLEFVDEVIIFDEPTPRELIMKIRPDIITKGGDYTVDQVVGNDLVNQVIIVPLVQGHSTTSLLEKLDEWPDFPV
jgi:D-beta-D-heptose 7-phosphate kinase/D-beta-D-heptose 1-phosphate adenosyltransferase